MDQKFSGHIAGETKEELGFLYERLLTNLDRELSVQQSLLQLLEEERATLTLASTEAIEETNVRKEALLIKAQENTADQRDIIDQICSVAGWAGKKVNLSGLIGMASDETTANKLRGRQQALTNIVDTIRINNRRNKELIQAALEDVQGFLRLIQNMVSPGGNYQKTGQLSLNSTQGSLIYREG